MCLQLSGRPINHEALGPISNTGKNNFVRLHECFFKFLKVPSTWAFFFFFLFKIMSLIQPAFGALNLALNITDQILLVAIQLCQHSEGVAGTS